MNIPIIMLIVASLSLGNALEITGGSDYLGEFFVYMTGQCQCLYSKHVDVAYGDFNKCCF
ncbi:MAG: hypothetical protein CM1200mP17_16380 [Woeseia sp.]|nr:MAG: hypothetical protein CM1200mP17_16380 [Woeseia sp.]